MALGKVITVDVKTGQRKLETKELPHLDVHDPPSTDGTLDIKKLKNVLLSKGIIAAWSEVE